MVGTGSLHGGGGGQPGGGHSSTSAAVWRSGHGEGAAEVRELATRLQEIAEDLAVRSGALALDLLEAYPSTYGRDLGVRTKSSDTDPVTIVDTGVEKFIREELQRLRPQDGVLGEEGGATEAGAGAEGATLPERGCSSVRWIVDPIDGTVNLLYGIPLYAVSIAAEVDGVVVAGAVHLPGVGETFVASAGAGASHLDREGRRQAIAVSQATDLSRSLVGTGFSYDPTVREEQGRVVAALLPKVRDIRRCGAAAVDLCMVAAGRLDAYYERCLKPWDYAAGALIAQEAGAVVRTSNDDGIPTVAVAPGVAAQFDALLALLGAGGAVSS